VIGSLSAQGVTKTPEELAGWLWYHGMKPSTKRAILKGEYHPKKLHDPEHLPKPIDLRGFNHSLVRIVPEIDQLIEVQLNLPGHIWDELVRITEGWKDVEVDKKAGRFVRRGKLNKATNLFLDRE
jgi:hypothetical protein